MITNRSKIITAALTAALTTALASLPAISADYYTITDLGTLGDATIASALNDNGVSVGYAVDILYRYHGFTSDQGIFSTFTPMGMTAQGQAMGINTHGHTIVASYMLGMLNTNALIFNGTMPMPIGNFMPCAINDHTQIVGSRFITDPDGFRLEQACFWELGSLTTLGQLDGSTTSIAKGLNDSGWAVGSATRPAALTPTATLWIGSTPSDLGTLGGSWSQATAINNARQVVGLSQTSTQQAHAFRYDLDASGSVTNRVDLGELGGGYSIANALNESGEIVGSSDNLAFLWSNGTMQDLNTLITPKTQWNLASATGINESGQIVGFGSFGGDPFRAFLLTPAQPCIADLNGDGFLDFIDISTFLSGYTKQDPIADLNNDSMFDFLDISAFLSVYSAGCP